MIYIVFLQVLESLKKIERVLPRMRNETKETLITVNAKSFELIK